MPLPRTPRSTLTFAAAMTATIALAGCASNKSTTQPIATHGLPEAQPAAIVDAKASLALDQISPTPQMPAAPPHAFDGSAPIDALMLYARARDEEDSGQRYVAIADLEKAALLDPASFDIQNDLARLYLSINSSSDQAEAALRRAAGLKPDDLQTQTDLGRVYLSRGELDRASRHLRLATQTTEYRTDADSSAVTDYYLAQALQKQGYDRAALDTYTQLLRRLQNSPEAVRDNPEIRYWLGRPELLYAEIGRLREKQGDPTAALAAYQVVADHAPNDLDTRQHMVGLLVGLNRRDDAARMAVESIVRSHASRQSLSMLRDAYRGDDSQAITALQRLFDQHPQDRMILFALSDLWIADGKPDRATQLLAAAEAEIQDQPNADDLQVIDKLFHVLADQGQTPKAARFLIETSADHPQDTEQLLPFWMTLLAPTRARRLHPADLSAMSVNANAVAARSYWIARLAVGRPVLLKESLAESMKLMPPYRPAYRFAISQLFDDNQLKPTDRAKQIDVLIGSIVKSDPALAMELRGIADTTEASFALHATPADRFVRSAADSASSAVQNLNAALQQGDDGPDVRETLATAELIKGDSAAYERMLWKLISDHPSDASAYSELYHYYQDHNQNERCVAVSQSWLLADPNDVAAQSLHIILLARAGMNGDAQKAIVDLYAAHPEDPPVMALLAQLIGGSDTNRFQTILENRLTSHAGDLAAVGQLVPVYIRQKRMSEAERTIGNARAAVAGDADQLYFVAHLYDLITPSGAKVNPQTEQTLQMALKVDGNNPGVNNDLGFEWADQGKNLVNAEAMIRRAIQLEPDNSAYLDSLGWVLYKRGEFDEAKPYLEKAIEPAATADPIVLDHLGDDLYRLNQNAVAGERWQDAMNRLNERLKSREADAGTGDDELNSLKLQLQQKLKQVHQGVPVNVAPAVEDGLKQARGD